MNTADVVSTVGSGGIGEDQAGAHVHIGQDIGLGLNIDLRERGDANMRS